MIKNMKETTTRLEKFAKKKPKSEVVTITETARKLSDRNLKLTIKFRLTPFGYGLCSHLKTILYFDRKPQKTFYIPIPTAMKNLKKELSVDVYTKLGQINSGQHNMTVEMGGLLPSGQPLGLISSENFTLDIPSFSETETQTRKQIVVERIEGEFGISILTSDIQKLYREMEERHKKEITALREGR
jgi:hypothetical protein